MLFSVFHIFILLFLCIFIISLFTDILFETSKIKDIAFSSCFDIIKVKNPDI